MSTTAFDDQFSPDTTADTTSRYQSFPIGKEMMLQDRLNHCTVTLVDPITGRSETRPKFSGHPSDDSINEILGWEEKVDKLAKEDEMIEEVFGREKMNDPEFQSSIFLARAMGRMLTEIFDKRAGGKQS